MDRRWWLRLTPPLAAAVAAGLIASGSLGATEAAWDPPPCPVGRPGPSAAARPPGSAVPGEAARGTWFTVDPLADDDGVLAGHRLRIGTRLERAASLDLPPESTVSGPDGGLVLVAADDGRRSEVRAYDRTAGCYRLLGASDQVIRRAVLDPGATAVYEFRVERETRSDLGVWRRPLDGSGPERVVGPLPDSAVHGPTFTTILSWSAEADRLAVQSCGALLCRTRLLDPATGAVTTLDAPDQGELVGVAGGRAIAYRACAGLPCPLFSTDVATGEETEVVDVAGLARLVETDDGPRLALETGTDGRLEIRSPDGALERSVPVDPALRLMPATDRAGAGIEVPSGWAVLTPDGRSPQGAVLARLSDGATVALDEVLR